MSIRGTLNPKSVCGLEGPVRPERTPQSPHRMRKPFFICPGSPGPTQDFQDTKRQMHTLANVLHFAKERVFLVWSERRVWSERTPRMRPVWSDPTLKCGRNVHRRSNITVSGHIPVGAGPDRMASWPARRALRPRYADGSRTNPHKSWLVGRIIALSRTTCYGGACQT